MHLLRYKDSAEHHMGQIDLLLHSHMYLHLILQDSIRLGSMYVLAGPDGLEEQRFCPAGLCHSQRKIRELTARGNSCWGVSGGNRQLSAMDTSHTHSGWGSISYQYTAQLHLHDFPCRFISPLKQVTLWQVRDLG